MFQSHAGVAHTRWATHGSPNALNSHPQVSDARNEFVIVHNGIITNHKALRDFLVPPPPPPPPPPPFRRRLPFWC